MATLGEVMGTVTTKATNASLCCGSKTYGESPVIEHNVRQPYPLAGNSQSVEATEILGVPFEPLVNPLLQWSTFGYYLMHMYDMV